MILYTLIETETGRVLSRGKGYTTEGLAQPGQTLLEQYAPETKNAWWDGTEFQVAPPKPAPKMAWNWATKIWEDLRTVEDARVEKRKQINGWRLEASYGGFTYGGKEIATDELSMIDLTKTGTQIARTGVMPANWPGAWKAKDNTYVPITTLADWGALEDAMYQQGLANFLRSQGLKALAEAAATAAEVDAITWETAL